MKIYALLIFLLAPLLCQAQDWSSVNIGTTENLNQVYFIDDNIGFIIGDNGTLFKTVDGGGNWMNIPTGVSHDLYTISFANQNVGFANGLKTIDGGDTWSVQPSTQQFALIKAFDEQNLIGGDYLFFHGEVYQSSDGGVTWTTIADPINTGFYTDEFFVNNDVGYMTSWYAGHLIKTIDGGATWNEIDLQPLIQWTDCEGVAFPTLDVGVVATDAHIIKTIDGGATWYSIYTFGDNMIDIAPRSIFAISETNYIVVGGYASGVLETIYETTDGGASWVLSNTSANTLEDIVCVSSGCFAVGENGTVLYNEIVIDDDGDGYPLTDDCDDNNPNINPGQTELPYNGIDDDCNPITLDDDLDQDGFVLQVDCDDNNPNSNPGETEIPYNGIDDDCDPATFDDDLDQDGFSIQIDCDDNNPNINPDIIEVPYNGVDDDCEPSTFDDDLDQDGFLLIDDCDDTNEHVNPDQIEILNNGIDDDCNPETLDDISSTILVLNNSTINIFPNPASERINFETRTQLSMAATLYGLEGRPISSSRNTSFIEIGEITNGTYLLELTDLASGQQVVTKIVVMK